MANAAIFSNLSNGLVNQAVLPSGPTAAMIYGPKSVPPVDAIEYSMKRTTGIATNQYPSERPKYYMRLGVSEYHRFSGQGGNMFQVARLEPFDNIILPLPLNMVDHHSVAYEQTAVGAFTGNLGNAIGEARNGNLAAAATSVGAAAAAVAVGGAAGVIAQLGSPGRRASIGAGAAVQSLMSAAVGLAGYAPNQFLTILLSGPEYKRHAFQWTFSPKNEGESSVLNGIIRNLNNYQAPGLAFGGALFTFPKIFRISVMPNSKYMYKFKPAVMTSFAVDFTGGGMPSFFRKNRTDGLNAPSVVTVRMEFLELEFWLNGNFSASNDPYDTQNGTPGGRNAGEYDGPIINYDPPNTNPGGGA